MTRTLLLTLFAFFSITAYSQSTFIRNMATGIQVRQVQETTDGGFIVAADSGGSSYLLKIDAYGNDVWSTRPYITGSNEHLNSAVQAQNGGYLICGSIVDPSTGDSKPFGALTDSMGSVVRIKIFASGFISGSEATLAFANSDNAYGIAVWTFTGAGTYSNNVYVLDGSFQDRWNTSTNSSSTGSSRMRANCAKERNEMNYFHSSYSYTAANPALLTRTDSVQRLLWTQAPDTIGGGCLGFSTGSIDLTPDRGIYFGTSLSPFSSSYDISWISRLDSSGNILWNHYLDWGFANPLNAVATARDSGAIAAFSCPNNLFFVHFNASGDSTWGRAYTGMNSCAQLDRTSDQGFIFHNENTIVKVNDSLQLPPPVNIQISTIGPLCPGQTTTLTAASGYDYAWSNGATTSSIQVGAGTYSVIISDPLTGLSATSDSVSISSFNTNSQISTLDPTSICQGDSVVLNSPSGMVSYLWSDGSTNSTLTATQSGSYFLTGIDINGCQIQSDTITVIQFQSPSVLITNSYDTLYASNAVSYQWFLNGIALAGATGVYYAPSSNGDYTVWVIDSNGCSGASSPYSYLSTAVSAVTTLTPTIAIAYRESLIHVESYVLQRGTLRIFDLRGTEILQILLVSDRPRQTWDIPITEVTSGIYLVSWESEGRSFAKKIFLN